MKRQLAIFSAVASIVLATAACGGGSDDTASTTPAAPSAAAPSVDAAAAGPMGPGCADYVKAVPSGAGSVDGMAQDPLATAASNNPLLTTLVSAVSGQLNPKVDLVDTLNGGQFTVFAPVDDAFKKVDAKTLTTLKKDSDLLTSVLTYHVVPGQLSPEKVVGMQKTVQGAELNVTGTPDALMVNGNSVICGGVKTSNATVYLIDGVLTPKS